ncbi:MAG TPA: DUF1800 domain-containing protein [Sphingomicrobium sp.]|nr:DUF1800 domain-containing protein [Sphingomicrobium sp.]
MNAAAIALNRFGLGARADDTPPADARRSLLQQFTRFDPRPDVIASVPPRGELARQLADYAQESRAERDRRKTSMRNASMPEPGDEQMSELPDSAKRYLKRGIREHYLVMNSARLASALSTGAPFVERLVHFWANHFAVSADKLAIVGYSGLLEFEAIRPHVLGRFADMLVAVEQHPAMLLYLDQAQSLGPSSRAARFGRKRSLARGLNENLAREILELHTVGVHAGYAQADVTEFARALTGWTIGGIARGRIARLLGDSVPPGNFLFAEIMHEPGDRTIMGRRYAQAGEAQGRAILSDLAAHPATARHLATKLARHFAGDVPPPAMVGRLERAYLESGGDLPTLYRATIESPEAWADRPLKFKTPWEWTVSALRGLSVKSLPEKIAAATLKELGQPTWQPGSPAGWDDIAASWAGPDALVRRVEVAERIADKAGPLIDPRAVAGHLLPGSLGESTRAAIAQAESPQQGLALLLVSPEFLRR